MLCLSDVLRLLDHLVERRARLKNLRLLRPLRLEEEAVISPRP